jgi:hypothetical protein
MEVLIATAILGSSIFLLLQAHYSAVRVFADVRDDALRLELMEYAMGMAEIEVRTGQLSAEEELGDRYPNHRYAYNAEMLGEEEDGLYEIEVTLIETVGGREIEFVRSLLIYHPIL